MPVLPITFRAASLPSNFRGTPQQFLDALVARLSVESQEDFALFVVGGIAPTSNVGPWLKNGTTWYVWDDVTGAYVPEVIEFQSLRYIVSEAAPDQAVYTIWIQTDSNGVATAIKTYSNGAWNDVYAAEFASLQTGIDRAYNTYPVGVKLSGAQTIDVDTSTHQVLFDTPVINPNNTYDSSGSAYTCPVAGIYRVDCNLQIDNGTASAAAMGIVINVYRNGTPPDFGPYSGDTTPSPNGSRWFPQLGGLISCSQGDKISIWVSGDDGVNTGNFTVAPQSQFFVSLERAA